MNTDDQIPTPIVDAATYSDWSGGAEATEPEVARQLERELIRLSAEREKERNVPLCAHHAEVWFCERHFEPGDCWFCEKDKQIDAANQRRGQAEQACREAQSTLAERDNQLAEVVAQCDKRQEHSLALLREAQDLRAQLLAAQTVISLLKKFRANHGLQHSGICAYRPGQLNMNCTCGCDELTDSLLASPDPTLLDEVKREKEDALKLCDELLEMVEEYHNCKWEDEPFTPDIDGLANRISRLRQSTRETEEKA